MDNFIRRPSGPTRISLARYSVLALPLAFSGLPIYIYAPDLYTTGRGVSLQSMGICLLAIRLIDAIQDPVIGRFSDQWHRLRLAFICGGLLILSAGFVMLYNPPLSLPALPWFILFMLFAAFGFSAVSINYNALGSLWSDEPHEKTSIVAAREGVGLSGLLLATLTPALLQIHFSVASGFRIYSALYLTLAAASFAIFSIWSLRLSGQCRQSRFATSDQERFDFWTIFHKPFGSLFAVYGLSTLASSIPGVLVVFFIRDRLHAAALTGPFLAIYFIAGIVVMPLWRKLAARFGKKRSWRIAMLLALVCFIGAYWLGPGDIAAYSAVCFFSGLALGAELILPLSIASDIIDQSERRAMTSSVFSIMLFTSKLSLAIASGSTFLFLSRSLYVPGALLLPAAASSLSVAYALIPSAIKLLAVGASHFLPEDRTTDPGQEKRRTIR